ncbi:Glutamate racemase 1 [Aliarcobacter thereius]|uniref:Glutamate racemase n=2 Tax=Aliarcobacter thereius TaxID=544718 RepID=A0A1C0B8A3_9BACT|nr:glutamate racemase [Aliarcobacter thereius]OCL87650.1 Glutamate racemase 1 [Aliarcobacter thereius]OCL93900.1 Glutamate racemase 1 [Aliarcobacter thereius]OCL95302.1 Glutamate racemase 1 [Aliarcobacter thereius LMG 24486]OCL99807.1 Glutamate racemase 1 [Aliarcobacter thereius]QBF16709.1 glutamate racemase [Aliarcobacter thereius LMG 24486]
MRVGLFDSGIGGLTILNTIVKNMKNIEFFYIADTLFAPYGEKDTKEILKRCDDITNYLINEHKIDILVVACNTATSISINYLRDKYKSLPIIGVEPALKPAIEYSKTKNIAILATPSTINGSKYKELVEKLSNNQKLNLYHIACSGLAKKIEEADIEENSLNLFLKNYLEELKDKNIDSVVLGCTHYPIIKNSIKSFFENGTKLYDSADAIAKRLKEITKDKIQSEKEQRVTILYSSKINFDMVNIILKDCKYDLRECKI